MTAFDGKAADAPALRLPVARIYNLRQSFIGNCNCVTSLNCPTARGDFEILNNSLSVCNDVGLVVSRFVGKEVVIRVFQLAIQGF